MMVLSKPNYLYNDMYMSNILIFQTQDIANIFPLDLLSNSIYNMQNRALFFFTRKCFVNIKVCIIFYNTYRRKS